MDEDRVEGAARNVGGKIKEGIGRAVGDKKLETDGKADQAAGKVQNTIGGIKDAFREGGRSDRRDR